MRWRSILDTVLLDTSLLGLHGVLSANEVMV